MTTTSSSVYDLLFGALKTMEAKSGNHTFTAARNKNDAKFKLQVRSGLSGSFQEAGELRYVEMPGKTFASQDLDLDYVDLLSRDLAKHSQNVNHQAQAAFGSIIGSLIGNLRVTDTTIGNIHSGRSPVRMYLDLKGHVLNEAKEEVGLLSIKFIFGTIPGYRR